MLKLCIQTYSLSCFLFDYSYYVFLHSRSETLKVFTVRLDDELGTLLENFCDQNKIKTSDALRNFIRDGLENFNTKTDNNYLEFKANTDLSKHQKVAISASIETLILLRHLVKDREILEKASKKTDEILKKNGS